MKSTKFITLTLTTAITLPTTGLAAEIPREIAPAGSTDESIAVTENLIGGILDEILAGEGYGMATARADTIIRNAVIADQTNGYGYGILAATSQNAIRYYRDRYLRPDYYAAEEERVKGLIADIISDVQNGKDYNLALDEAYTRVYQAADPTYDPEVDRAGDFCYWDVPSVDAASLTIARKLLLAAMPTE
ncbi:MAG: hypothetical protein Q4G33_08480 [bacterium]|nr:hypothetical protein [bacterium]